MHQEALAFLTHVLTPERVAHTHILEIGAYNVNGSARDLCADCARYVGVDRRDGPGVDVVDSDDSFDGAGQFDLVISSETLEHAPDPAGLLASAWQALKPGGLLILTAAGPDRTPHRCDGGPRPDLAGEHYAAITVAQLAGLLDDWIDVDVRYGESHGQPCGDVYATATKPTGGTFITSGPTTLVVGDTGPEIVTVRPVRRRKAA